MSRSPDNMHRSVSEMLSEVMSDIGVNERLVMKRRRAHLLCETIYNIAMLSFGEMSTMYNFGSQSEGSTTIGICSDSDSLFTVNNLNVIHSMKEWKQGKLNHKMIQNESISPGYCYLKVLRADQPLPVTADDALHHALVNYVTDSKGGLLLKNTMNDLYPKCYPAYMGIALYCKSLPNQALSGLPKQGMGKWPTEDVLNECRNAGCFVVPVGSKAHVSDVLESELEWRISTSLQERYLIFSLNITQLMCYVLMKMILTTHINPYVEDVLSSFMCKNVLFYCIANSSHAWHPGTLLSNVHLCLFMLKECVEQRNCPHFLLPETNLLTGHMTSIQRGKLLDIMNTLMSNSEQLLFGIQIDDLGMRLKMKLNMIPYSPCVPSASFISKVISLGLVYFISETSNSLHQVLLNKIKHASLEMTIQYLYETWSALKRYRHKGDLQNTASELLIPMVSSTLGSVLASKDISTNMSISGQAFTYLKAGKESDALSGRLKLVSVLYCTGDIVSAQQELTIMHTQYNISDIQTVCGCYVNATYMPCGKLGGTSAFEYHNEEAIRSNIAFCTRFLQCEINTVPKELRYEMLRSYIDEENQMRTSEYPEWMDFIVVDSIPYLYFLQYKTYGHLQRGNDQLHALHNLAFSIAYETGLCHRESALNLLGQCMEQENIQSEALRCYIASLYCRSQNNAARVLLCIQLFKLTERDIPSMTQTAKIDTRDNNLINQKLFQLRWLLTNVGTTVLRKCFDELICDDFAKYFATNEAEKIKLHWLIDTHRISELHATLLPGFDNTILASNDEKLGKTFLTPSDQIPSSNSVANSEKMISLDKSSEFDYTFPTGLRKFISGLCAPNDEVWKKSLPKDMSVEAFISRLWTFWKKESPVQIHAITFSSKQRKLEMPCQLNRLACINEISPRPDIEIRNEIPFAKTPLSSNDENSTLDQTPTSYSLDNYKNILSSAQSSKFDITLLTVLLRFVCGLAAPNDDVWKRPLPEDVSTEADITRLGECMNNIIKWDSFEDDPDDEKIDVQRQKLHEILTRLDNSVDIQDDVEFDGHLDYLHRQLLEEWYKNDQKNLKLEEEYAQSNLFQDSDDDNAWTKDEETVLKLLHDGKLPNTIQLVEICKTFQPNSYIVRQVCGYICNTLEMTSSHITRCWPAYVYDKRNKTNSNLVTFVAVKDTEDKLNIDTIFGYNIKVYEQFNDSHSAESTEINNQDMKHTRRFNDKLEKCLRKHSSSLMRSHSNITLIAGSTVKSVGYNREIGKGTTISKPCIVIYVQTKGYIPLGEEPFPTKLDDFDTDVRECVVSLYSNSRAYQKDEHLLMGTSIKRKGLKKAGTLGGFLEHPEYSLCGLTCAHVVLRTGERNTLSGLKHFRTGNDRTVVQPATPGGDDIGKVVCALLRRDEPVGIDIALVKIQARPPNSGQFAIGEENCEHKYNSGNTLHWKNIQRGAKLIKFGCETGHTEADYQYLGTGSLRYDNVHLPNQLIIRNHHKPSQTDRVADERPAQAGPFAAAGDSGALCFVEDSQGLHAVGVIVGGSGDLNHCFLTPIHDILDALKEKDTAQVTMRTLPDHEPMEH